MLNLITDLTGVRVGHATDLEAVSGVTCLLFDRPNFATALVGGGAPGTRGVSILAPDTINYDVDAIVLSGGSAFGLDAAGGVMARLAAQGIGFAVGSTRVPIVVQAIIFDLNSGGVINHDAPTYWHLGASAAGAAAIGSFATGSIGGGTGATTADFKGGVGSASAKLASGHTIAALTVVNAVGTATINQSQHFWAADVEQGAEYGGHGWPKHAFNSEPDALKGAGPATTVSVIATDAALTKAELHRLAIMANGGLNRAIRPANAPMDGDVIFAVALPRIPVTDVIAHTRLGQAAADCLARAIARGVYDADIPCAAYNGPPTYRSYHAAT